MIIKLVMVASLFLPGWAEGNTDLQVALHRSEQIMESMSACERQAAQVEDATGVYTKTYPFTDEEFRIAVSAICVRVEEDKKASPTSF